MFPLYIMPTNVGYEYVNAEKEYHEAKSTSQKIKALRSMLTAVPKHKGTEKMQAQIKKQIAKLQSQLTIEKTKGKSSYSSSIKKEGAATIAIVGKTNTGKSFLLSKLSGKKVKVSEYEFTTMTPEVRMIPYENVMIQGIEIPPIYEKFYESKNGRQILSNIRLADLVIVLANSKKDFDIIKSELSKANINLVMKPKNTSLFEIELPYLRINKSDFSRKIVPKIWKYVKKIRIQTKTSGKIAEKPIVLDENSRIEDVARTIHQDFLKNFRFARVWGPSSKFDGQQVGLDHKLKDKDIVEIFTK